MKKPINRNRNGISHPAITITTTLVEPSLLKNLVEKLADRRYDTGYNLEKVQLGWQAIETSSIEAYVSGDANLCTPTDLINMPFTSSFLFTCTKGKRQDYKLAWVCSLS